MKKSILLLSSSLVHGYGFLDFYKPVIGDFLKQKNIPKILFVPYAAPMDQWDSYTEKARQFFKQFGAEVTGIHQVSTPVDMLNEFNIVFVGGGNTFRLLHTLHSNGQFYILQSIVKTGKMFYIGSSAGTNLASKSICTTNDMPIVYPERGFDALNFFPYQINPHYVETDASSTHMGETREQRIAEFHQMNNTLVVGLPEGTYILLDHDFGETYEVFIGGKSAATIFRRGESAQMLPHEKVFVLK